MVLTDVQFKTLLEAAKTISFDAPLRPVADFVTSVLSLDEAAQMALFGDSNSEELLRVTNALTGEVDHLLNFEGGIPPFGVLITEAQPDRIAGFGVILSVCGADPKLVSRLKYHAGIRSVLIDIAQGHDLEAIAAAILQAACGNADATKGSGDQGIDVVGWQSILPTEPLFASLIERGKQWALPSWEKVFFLASSKANLGKKPKRDLINPAFIRELVGGWVIQRSSIGQWSQIGISPLSALQLILVTTYRLSADARKECRSLGVQIWSLSELIFLIGRHAPNAVFGETGDGAFDESAFKAWWGEKGKTRLSRITADEVLSDVI